MNHNYRIILILIVILAIISFAIGIDKIDPFYKTDITKSATVQNVAYATGKSGARIELVLKENDGTTYIRQTSDNKYRKGSKVTLKLYKRKITGLEKYELY